MGIPIFIQWSYNSHIVTEHLYRGIIKMYSYEPLWETLREKGISTYKLIYVYGLSKGTLHSMKHGQNVTMQTIDWFCQLLEVPIEKVVSISIDKFQDRQTAYLESSDEHTQGRDQ